MIDQHWLEFEVRDSELDILGIVNHAYYFVYLEHARVKVVKDKANISFYEYAKQGKNLIIKSLVADFKKSLVSGDNFYVVSWFEPESKVQFAIKQNIIRGDELIMSARFNLTCYEASANKKFYIPQEIQNLISSL